MRVHCIISCAALLALAGCDGEEEACASLHPDVDGDGYGAPAAAEVCGADTSGFVTNGDDCDDDDGDVHPDADESDDGVDEDCDGDAVELDLFDGDLDGYTPGYGSEDNPTPDCDDSDDSIAPGAAPNDDASACMRDVDGDDWGDASATAPVSPGTDCDDADPLTAPGAAESDDASACMRDADEDGWGDAAADGAITPGADCDDSDDNTAPGVAPNDDASACMRDEDGDDWGDDTPPAGVTPGSDCDDQDLSTAPGAAPNDDAVVCMRDADGDDWGDATASGPFVAGTDCDDGDANTSPAAAPNDDVGACMTDADQDDWGDATAASPVTTGSDCDDADATVYPGAAELDDGADQDCDGDVIELLQFDIDFDGYTPGYGAETDATPDCDDSDVLRNPAIPELPDDGVDNDCLGDGDLVAASGGGIYVDPAAADGCDDAVGTMATPACTIAGALSLGDAEPLFVAAGTYVEYVAVATKHSLFGGYDPTNWTRSTTPATTTTIEAVTSQGTQLTGSEAIAIERFTFVGRSGGVGANGLLVHGTTFVVNNVLTGGSNVSMSTGLEAQNTAFVAHNSFVHNQTAVTNAHGAWLGNGVRFVENECAPATAASTETQCLWAGDSGWIAGNTIHGGDGTSQRTIGIETGSNSTADPLYIIANTIVGGGGTNTSLAVEITSGGTLLVNNHIDGGTSPTSARAVFMGDGAIVAHNVIFGGTSAATEGVYSSGADAVCINNAINGGDASGESIGIYLNLNANETVTVLNNDIYGVNQDVVLRSGGVSYDLAEVNACSWSGCAQSGGNLSVAPLLTSDGHLTGSSPLIDAGVDPLTLGIEVPRDFDDDPRPNGGWDIGLDEQ